MAVVIMTMKMRFHCGNSKKGSFPLHGDIFFKESDIFFTLRLSKEKWQSALPSTQGSADI